MTSFFFQWGLYAEPIFSEEGGFPKELANEIAQNSARQGYTRSRLPEFTEEEKAYVRGASDFFGVNHYTAYMVEAVDYGDAEPSLYVDSASNGFSSSDWTPSASGWLYVCITNYIIYY